VDSDNKKALLYIKKDSISSMAYEIEHSFIIVAELD
jgi:hypothetical protein